MDQQGSGIAVSHFGDAQRLGFTASGVLTWHKTEKGGEFPAVFEVRSHTGKAQQYRGGHHADAGHLHQALAGFVLFEDIFAGRCRTVPNKPDALYALTSSMLAFARKCANDLVAMGHSVRYALTLPPDFSFMLLRDYMALEDGYRNKLLAIPDFAEWLRRNERLL